MSAAGLVTQSAVVRDSAWQFTNRGFEQLRAQVTLKNLTRFLRADPKKPKETCSTFELLDILEQNRWKHQVFVRGSPQPVPYPLRSTKREDKVFWSKQGDTKFDRTYLLVLVLATTDTEFVELIESRCITEVEHLRNSSHYDAFVHLRKAQQKGHIEIDFEGPLGLPQSEEAVLGKARKDRRYRLQKSFQWGGVSIVWRKPTPKEPCAGYQVTCPRRSHLKFLGSGRITKCTKTFRYLEADEETSRARGSGAFRCVSLTEPLSWSDKHHKNNSGEHDRALEVLGGLRDAVRLQAGPPELDAFCQRSARRSEVGSHGAAGGPGHDGCG